MRWPWQRQRPAKPVTIDWQAVIADAVLLDEWREATDALTTNMDFETWRAWSTVRLSHFATTDIGDIRL